MSKIRQNILIAVLIAVILVLSLLLFFGEKLAGNFIGQRNNNGNQENLSQVVYNITDKMLTADGKSKAETRYEVSIKDVLINNQRWLEYNISRNQARARILLRLENNIIKNYRVKINNEPEIDYQNENGEALLPRIPMAKYLILPGQYQEFTEKQLDQAVPITGLRSASFNSPFLDREITLKESGISDGRISDEGTSVIVRIDTRYETGMFVPRKINYEGDYLCCENYRWEYGEIDYPKIDEFIEAGVNSFSANAIIEVITKNLAGRLQTAREFSDYMKAKNAYYSHSIASAYDFFDMFRSNFITLPALDEPYAHFNQSKDSSGAAAVTGQYEDFVRSLYPPTVGWWNENLPASFNYPIAVSWYDLEAGASGFINEGLGSYELATLKYFNENFSLDIPLTLDNVVNLQAAFMAGASRQFQKPWGLGIYISTGHPLAEQISPNLNNQEKLRLIENEIRPELVEKLFVAGARIFALWAYHEDGPISPANALSLARQIKDLANASSNQPPVADTAIILPYGTLVPACLDKDGLNCWGWSGDEHIVVLENLGTNIKSLLLANKKFHILIDVIPEGYQEIIDLRGFAQTGTTKENQPKAGSKDNQSKDSQANNNQTVCENLSETACAVNNICAPYYNDDGSYRKCSLK